MPTYVYKVGGSLLDLADLPARLGRVLALTPGVRPLLVVGGGGAADLVREWDRRHQLGDERAHWLALRAMMLTETLLAELIPDCRIVGTREEAVAAWAEARLPIVCAHDFLRDEEASILRSSDRRADDLLPHTWEVTSDSIAAWISLRWPAEGLVLLKSCGADKPSSTVDSHFQRVAIGLRRIEWINLRAELPTSL